MQVNTIDDIKRITQEIVEISHSLKRRGSEPQPNKFFMQAMMHANICVLLCHNTKGFPIFFANEQFLKETGYSRDEVMQKSCAFLQGAETAVETVNQMREALHDEKPVTVKVKNYRKDGSPFWNELFLSPIRNDNGETYAFIGIQKVLPESNRALDS